MERPNFKKICMMHIQQLSNFPFVENDIDALTDYGFLCRVIDHLNQVIANQNTTNQALINLVNAFNELKDYVDNYFDNLDVQDEINNKLDEMTQDGTLTTLIGEYVNPIINEFKNDINDDIADFESLVNQTITEQNGKINALESGSPLAASSTDDMTDTTRIYVNTTDGYWYYYDGDSWEQGGVYQGLVLDNNIVGYTNLTGELQKDINKELIDEKYDCLLLNKYLHDNNHVLTDSISGLYCLRIPATSDYILKIDKSTFAQESEYRTTYCDGVDGTDYKIENIKASSYRINSNHIILENPYDDNSWYILIEANSDYPYCFINLKTGDYEIPVSKIGLYKLSSLTNNEDNLKYISGLIADTTRFNKNLMKTNLNIHGYPYWSGSNLNIGEINGTLANNQLSSFIYLPSGTDLYVYTKSSQNYIMVFDDDLSYSSYIKITDAEKIVFNNQIYYKKKLSYESNKYVVGIDKLGASTYNLICSFIDISNENIIEIDGKRIDNNIPLKNWYLFGDSITHKGARALVNYADWTARDINISLHNYGVSAQGYMQGNSKFISELSNLTSYDPETDIITVMGSINDLSHVANDLGELGDTTDDTLYGAMYVFYTTLFATYPGCRVGIISPITSINVHNNETTKERMRLYVKALKETAEYFNIPFLDILNSGNLRPWETDFLNEYYVQDGEGGTEQVDETGVHPNSKGHQLFYGRIREFIKTL